MTRKPEHYKPDVKSYRGCTAGINGWCTEADVKEYKRLVSSIHDGNMIEVGAYEGLSLYYIKDICKENNIKLYCVDFIAWPKLLENVKSWGIEFINIPSVEAANKFQDGYFDLIYIDADHHTGEIVHDIWAWLPKLKKQGILAGHDYELHGIRKGLNYIFGNLDLFEVGGTIWSIQLPHEKVVKWK